MQSCTSKARLLHGQLAVEKTLVCLLQPPRYIRTGETEQLWRGWLCMYACNCIFVAQGRPEQGTVQPAGCSKLWQHRLCDAEAPDVLQDTQTAHR